MVYNKGYVYVLYKSMKRLNKSILKYLNQTIKPRDIRKNLKIRIKKNN